MMCWLPGGTLIAGAKLVERCGAVIESVAVALEINELPGRESFAAVFPNIALNSLFLK